MRLISQHGNVDIPYENAILSHNNNIVRADVDNFDFTMGIYSSGEKAYKVMEMVRKAYLGIPVVLQNVEVPNDAEKFFGDKNIIYACIPEQKPKVEYLNNAIFQFPPDDEVEV